LLNKLQIEPLPDELIIKILISLSSMNILLFCLFVLIALFGASQAQEYFCYQETFCLGTNEAGEATDCQEMQVCNDGNY